MKSSTPKITAWVLIAIAIPIFMLFGTVILFSFWGLCGDSVNCDPSASAWIQVIGVDILTILSIIGVILPIVANFKLGSYLGKNPRYEVPQSYYKMNVSIAVAAVALLLGTQRILPDLAYMAIMWIGCIFALFFSVRFLRTYRKQ